MQCINGTAHGYEDLYEAFAKSCNCTFSEIGCSLNITNFTNLCNSMLFNQDLPTDIDHKQSSFSIDDNVFTIMQTSIGQGQTLVTPLHLAMLASCVANNGTLMKPYIVSEIQDSNGETVTTYNPEVAAQLMTSDQANVLSTFMREVVSASYGTANALKSSLYTAYGKTGTAQIGSLLEGTAQSNALFMGYAEDENGKKIAICIVLENIGDGKSPVVSIAKDILDYYYNN
jgi:peptidoglycan glycosyltransferase